MLIYFMFKLQWHKQISKTWNGLEAQVYKHWIELEAQAQRLCTDGRKQKEVS